MKVFKLTSRIKPKISLILLDWSVRESFHLLHYLSLQNIPRDQFEVVIIEYYSRRSEAIEKFEEQVDTWIALEMSEDLYYHKHLMYNAGIMASTGEICIICDSDAMAKPTFLESVIKAFEQEPNLILHLDQFRNNRKDLYPFCYPSFEDVTGSGCINIENGKTTGLAVTEDLIHNRNYGACFCAKREDLIKIGGADEHIDFIGHICGPYDFTFRLMNIGKKELWHETEFLYHTWHPGQAGEHNYLGPHDGRHVSTTSLEVLTSNRVSPHVINPAIAKLQKDSSLRIKDLEQDIIFPYYKEISKMSFLMNKKSRIWAEKTYLYIYYRGYIIITNQLGGWYALPACIFWKKNSENRNHKLKVEANTLNQIKIKIDEGSNFKKNLITKIIYSFFIYRVLRRMTGKLINKITLSYKFKQNKKMKSLNLPKINDKNFIVSKLEAIKKEGKYFEHDIYSFVFNLNVYLSLKGTEEVVLLVLNKSEYFFFHFLMKFKLIPNISVLIINEKNLGSIKNNQHVSSRETYIQKLNMINDNNITIDII